jgi:3-hydroxyacyl-CoA dehydrogenase/enoyl-CoA hydratase/3-hydroxybutyryl-CoA epimerase/enoyl-CoA isomerase
MSAPSSAALRLEVMAPAVAVLTFDQPGSRANTLGQAVLAEFEAVLADLGRRSDLQGLILRSGKPGMFVAGADLRELGSAIRSMEPAMRMVQRGLGIIAAIENLPFPTVAAIEGPCLGGGLELALGFDFRLAGTHPKTEIGLPETKIGLIPGWGGTQRLARVIGPATAVELICAGESLKPDRARALGLVFDAVPPDRLFDEALRLVQWARETGAWEAARQQKRQPVGLSEEQLSFTFAVAKAQVLAKTKGQLPAPLAALEAVRRGCNLPLDEGLKVETEQFVPLVGSPISRNLIAVFFMTQRLQKDPGVADPTVQPRPVERVGVIGAGLMGAGIAGAHVRRGIPVTLVDTAPEFLEKGVASITRVIQGRIEIGRATPADLVQALGRLSATTLLPPLADRDVVIEAIVENEAAKTELYQKLRDLLSADAILASNTSTISITRMAQSWSKPENFAGMHFFNPVDRMQLVEVIRGEKTSDGTTATLVALAKKIGKTPIVVRDCPGFLVNRILFPYLNEALVLVEEGDDVVGLDTSLYAGRVIDAAFPDRSVQTRLLTELVRMGRLGQKTGAGFYSYAKGSRGADDPVTINMVKKYRTADRAISPEELTDRLFLPMLTEASRVLEEGIVRDPADVDMGLILGIGFPAAKGGLLRWADSLGLAEVLKKLQKYEHLGKRFQATEQMKRLAAAGKGFYAE